MWRIPAAGRSGLRIRREPVAHGSAKCLLRAAALRSAQTSYQYAIADYATNFYVILGIVLATFSVSIFITVFVTRNVTRNIAYFNEAHENERRVVMEAY